MVLSLVLATACRSDPGTSGHTDARTAAAAGSRAAEILAALPDTAARTGTPSGHQPGCAAQVFAQDRQAKPRKFYLWAVCTGPGPDGSHGAFSEPIVGVVAAGGTLITRVDQPAEADFGGSVKRLFPASLQQGITDLKVGVDIDALAETAAARAH